jgi:6-phosphogluconolactonase (cycloisomerase 2 family)
VPAAPAAGSPALGTEFLRNEEHCRERPHLGLDPAQTPEFTHTLGQIAFAPDGSKIVIATANGNEVDVFAVHRLGDLSARPTVHTDPGAVPFAVTFDRSGHLAVAEAGTDAVATFTVNGNGTLGLIGRVTTGQAATCWLTATGTALYASNAGSGSLSGYLDNGGGTLAAIGNTATHPGTVDAATSDGHYLYVQTGADGIVDGFRVNTGGSLTPIGSVTVPGAIGGEESPRAEPNRATPHTCSGLIATAQPAGAFLALEAQLVAHPLDVNLGRAGTCRCAWAVPMTAPSAHHRRVRPQAEAAAVNYGRQPRAQTGTVSDAWSAMRWKPGDSRVFPPRCWRQVRSCHR